MGYLPAVAGIYAITHITSGKQYIGSSSYIGRRWHTHRTMLRKGTHYNLALQRAWTKYGEDAFAFTVLERVENATADLLINREQYYLDARREATGNNGLNLRSVANNPTNHVTTVATRQKISAAKKGRAFTDKHRQKLSEARKRWRSSPAFVAARQGPRPYRHLSERARADLQAARWSEESRARSKAKLEAMSQEERDALAAKRSTNIKRAKALGRAMRRGLYVQLPLGL